MQVKYFSLQVVQKQKSLSCFLTTGKSCYTWTGVCPSNLTHTVTPNCELEFFRYKTLMKDLHCCSNEFGCHGFIVNQHSLFYGNILNNSLFSGIKSNLYCLRYNKSTICTCFLSLQENSNSQRTKEMNLTFSVFLHLTCIVCLMKVL